MKQLTSIFFILLSISHYGQVLLDARTEEKEFRVDQNFTFTVIMELKGASINQETPLRLPDFSKFNVVGNASDNNEILLDDGLVRQVIVQFVLQPKQPGKVRLGSALVTVNGVQYKTEPIDIFVKEADRKVIGEKKVVKDRDMYLNLEVENDEVYRNEPAIAVLRAYSKNYNNFRRVKDIQFPDQDNIDFTPIHHVKQEIETSAGQVNSQVMAVFLVFSGETGNVEIEPLSANYVGDPRKLISNKVKLKVKELPEEAPAGFKNAVGDFKVGISTPTEIKAEIQKPFMVQLKVSGKGNFQDVVIPKILESVDYDVFQPKITERMSIQESGVTGEIVADYVIVPKRTGVLKIATDRFAFFNPEIKKYVDVGAKTLDIMSLTHEQILDDRSTMERINEYTNNVLETVDNPVIKTEPLKVDKKQNFRWRTIMINFGLLSLVGLAFLIFPKFKKNKAKINNPAKPIVGVEETENQIKNELKSDFNDYVSYMKHQIGNDDFDGFFGTFEELDASIRKQYFVGDGEDFKGVVEKQFGSQMSDSYQNLTRRVHMEKYAPMHHRETMEELLEAVQSLYSQISK